MFKLAPGRLFSVEWEHWGDCEQKDLRPDAENVGPRETASGKAGVSMENVDRADDASKRYAEAEYERADVGPRTIVVLTWEVAPGDEERETYAAACELARRALDGGARVTEISRVRIRATHGAPTTVVAIKLSLQFQRDEQHALAIIRWL